MKPNTHIVRHLPRLLHAALAVYLTGAVFAVTLHQHRDATPHHDCTLCAAAHVPALKPVGAAPVAPAQVYSRIVAVAVGAYHGTEPGLAFPSRAPPQG
jgi:hypothetical protein